MINLSNRVLFQALECAPQPTVIADARKPGLTIAYVNPAFEALTGHDGDMLVGSALSKLVCGGDLPGVDTATTGQWMAMDRRRLQQRWRIKKGRPLTVDVHVSALYETPGRPSYWLVTQVGGSVEDAKAPPGEETLRGVIQDARRKLHRIGRSDVVTGLPNRKAFTEAVQRDWSIACREHCRLGVIIFKVDALDGYRELFGRHATESVLRKIGHAITGSLRRAGDLAARLDDDRFVALVGGIDEEQALALSKRIQAKVSSLYEHHPRSNARYVTVSFGLASQIPDRAGSPEILVEKAEEDLNDKLAQHPGDNATKAGTG